MTIAIFIASPPDMRLLGANMKSKTSLGELGFADLMSDAHSATPSKAKNAMSIAQQGFERSLNKLRFQIAVLVPENASVEIEASRIGEEFAQLISRFETETGKKLGEALQAAVSYQGMQLEQAPSLDPSIQIDTAGRDNTISSMSVEGILALVEHLAGDLLMQPELMTGSDRTALEALVPKGLYGALPSNTVPGTTAPLDIAKMVSHSLIASVLQANATDSKYEPILPKMAAPAGPAELQLGVGNAKHQPVGPNSLDSPQTIDRDFTLPSEARLTRIGQVSPVGSFQAPASLSELTLRVETLVSTDKAPRVVARTPDGRKTLIEIDGKTADEKPLSMRPLLREIAITDVEIEDLAFLETRTSATSAIKGNFPSDLLNALPSTIQTNPPGAAQNLTGGTPESSASRPAGFSLALAHQLRNVHLEEGTTRVQLSPKGLGTIEIELTTELDKSTSIVIRSDTPTVLTSLREIRDLLAHMMDLGNDGSLSFEDRSGRDDREMYPDGTFGADGREKGTLEGVGPNVAIGAAIITDSSLDITT